MAVQRTLKSILLTASLAACSDLPTYPIIEQPPAEQESNDYRPSTTLRLDYSEPTVLGTVRVHDHDGQGVAYSCEVRRGNGSVLRFERASSGTTLEDTLRAQEPRSEQDKYVLASCEGSAQGERQAARDSLLVQRRTDPPPNPRALLDLEQQAPNGKTYRQNLTDLTEALFRPENHLVVLREINGQELALVPWYTTSSNSRVEDLHAEPYISSASRERFLMVTDELSEACIVAAAGTDERLVRAFRNTITATSSSGLPGWIAEVNGNRMTLRDHGSASDATARLGSCMYLAANNPSLEERASYRAVADELLRKHLQLEYVHVPQGVMSPVSGKRLFHIAAGGSGTASAGLSGMEMWQGYYGDNALFLLAGFASTGDQAVLERVREVIDQSLIAAEYEPQRPRVGHFKMRWRLEGDTLRPRAPASNDYFWNPSNPSWDTHDAPRFLHVFRVLEEAKRLGEDTHSGVYSHLRSLGEHLISNGSQSGSSSCTQYFLDGRPVQGNCGSDPFSNGIGGQMMIGLRPEWVRGKLDESLRQIDWSRGAPWGSAVPGVYRNTRLPKLLIAAGGLDAALYAR